MERENLSKKIDLAFLSAFYSGMLTEKQRRVLSLHCEEDLSLGEIADEVGISRQAVSERAASACVLMKSSSAASSSAVRQIPPIDPGKRSSSGFTT